MMKRVKVEMFFFQSHGKKFLDTVTISVAFISSVFSVVPEPLILKENRPLQLIFFILL